MGCPGDDDAPGFDQQAVASYRAWRGMPLAWGGCCLGDLDGKAPRLGCARNWRRLFVRDNGRALGRRNVRPGWRAETGECATWFCPCLTIPLAAARFPARRRRGDSGKSRWNLARRLRSPSRKYNLPQTVTLCPGSMRPNHGNKWKQARSSPHWTRPNRLLEARATVRRPSWPVTRSAAGRRFPAVHHQLQRTGAAPHRINPR